ncbi:MAG: hypothetical protein JNN30_01705 [Rhodanobacteraceae bacterium]|nr:hypothetical protein [Rhodanobacteraceae bacterium]
MAHFVTGLIARHAALRNVATRYGLVTPIALTEVMSLLPLDADALERLQPEEQHEFYDGFNYLSLALARTLKFASDRCMLLYFETEYFGGMGTQGAAVFRDGEIVFGPQSAELGPINNALAVLGVRVQPPAVDEFETVGLQRHNSAEEWLNSVPPPVPR